MLVIALVVIVAGATLLIIEAVAESAGNSIFNLEAKNDDVKGYWTDNNSMKVYTFIPSKNIYGLEFTFYFYSSDGMLIGQSTKSFGDVNKKEQYSIPLASSEYGEATKIHVVINGTVGIF